ncbi:MAG: FUSC family protein [Lacunisphaera sp.]
MKREGPLARIRSYLERERLQPDINRGLRSTVGFMGPFLAVLWWDLPVEVSLAAIAGQNIAMVDIRGSYPLRLSLLLAMSAIFAGASWLGGMGANSFSLALLVITLVTLATGVWRHLSVDYGPSLASMSVFLALLTLALPGGETPASRHFLATLAGGLWGVLVQVSLWPLRAQHPLRRVVSDSWLALSDLLAAMTPDESTNPAARLRLVAEKEALLRTTLNQSNATLAAQSGKRRVHLKELEELNLAAARFGTRLIALNTALESLMERSDFAALAPSFNPVFTSLTNTTRTIALTVVSRQPAHLAAADVRLLRLGNLLRALQDRVDTQTQHAPAAAQLADILEQIGQLIPRTQAALRATVDRVNEHVAFSLELFDLKTWTLRPLASALNFHWPPDRALVRFILRLTVLQLAGVAVMKYFDLTRGYWLPLTILVVLQPDYGTTRLRAGQRVIGTITGGLIASALLWLHPPNAVLFVAMSATLFGFAFWLKRNYAIAVFFITLFVVLITETAGSVTVAFTLERLTATLAGGLCAMIAAQLFWPVWERNLFPGILARALRANRDYLARLAEALVAGRSYDAPVIEAKRAAETANSDLFTSLQRMSADPEREQADLEAAAALANGNQRLTRYLTVVAVHLGGPRVPDPELAGFAAVATETLERLARAAETESPDAAGFAQLRARLDALSLPVIPATAGPEAKIRHGAYAQFARCATELGAMLLAAQPAIEQRVSR